MKKKPYSNYIRMLWAILNKSWRQHLTKQQLYGHLPPIIKTIQVRRTRHVRHCWRSKDKLISDILQWTPSHGRAKAGRPARTYTQQLFYQERWVIDWCGERGPKKSVLVARHDDEDCFGFFFFLVILVAHKKISFLVAVNHWVVCVVFSPSMRWIIVDVV